jgi:hypothetical protein
MSEPKTRPTADSVADFVAAVEDPRRRADAEAALELLAEASGEPPVMWGTSIVGFGAYTQEGAGKKPVDWPIIGFSPRRAELVFYIMPGFSEYEALLERLGKHRKGASCLYVKRMDDVDRDVLRELAMRSVAMMRERYPAA